jgi:hypothetical protein
MIFEWSVNQTGSPSATELQEALNTLERQGYEIQSIFAVGHSVMVVARRRLQATASAVTPHPDGDEEERAR